MIEWCVTVGRIRELTARIIYLGDDVLLCSPSRKVQNTFIAQAVVGCAGSSLCSGIFLSGLLRYMGAGDEQINFLWSLGPIISFISIFWGLVLERSRNLPRAGWKLNALNKFFSCVVVAVPALIPGPYQITAAFTTIILASFFGSGHALAMAVIIGKGIPEQTRGRYLALRYIYINATTLVIPVLGALLIDTMGRESYLPFIIVFCVAALMCFFDVLAVFHVRNDIPDVRTQHVSIKDTILVPLRNKKFMRFMALAMLLIFFTNFAQTINYVFMETQLKFSFSVMNLVTLFSALINMFILKPIGHLCERIGSGRVLFLSLLAYMTDAVFRALSNTSTMYLTMPLSVIALAVASSTMTISIFTRRFELMNGNQSLYEGFFAFMLSPMYLFSALLASHVQSWLKPMFPFESLFSSNQIIYAISAVCILLLFIAFGVIGGELTGGRNKNVQKEGG